MTRNFLLAGAALLAVAGFGAASPARAQDTIKVATAGPITGEYAAFGAQMKEGAEQAVADINAKGGVLGKKLDLEVGDDACDPKQAVSVANKFASDGVKFVDGHFCSSSSIPASDVYKEEGILQITPASTNPKFTDRGYWNTFRTCGRDDQQGKVAGHTLATEYKNDRVAILNDNSTYGKGIADETKKNMNAEGKQEALYETYTPGERDYSALVSRLKEAKIQVIYIGGYHPEVGLIARQAKQQGLDAQVLGPDSLATKELWQVGGDAIEGLKNTFPADPRKLPTAAAVVKEFEAKGVNPEGYVLYTYAAMQVFAEAATKAGTTNSETVAKTIKADGPWPTVLGSLTYDSKGDTKNGGYVWYIWHDGDYKEM
jgi:branched-chain amino acid transport system substrate-binding protein